MSVPDAGLHALPRLASGAWAEQPVPGRFTQVGGHLVFALVTAVVVAAALLLILRSRRRQVTAWPDLPAPRPLPADLPDDLPDDPAGDLPDPPAEGGVPHGVRAAPPLAGLFLGTTVAGRWLDRVGAHRLADRRTGTLRTYRGGVAFDLGGGGFLIPAADLRGVRVDRAHAGTVIGPRGLLVITWQLGDRVLESGFRGEDPTAYPAWVAALDVPADRTIG